MPRGNRTTDTGIFNPVLYRLSYPRLAELSCLDGLCQECFGCLGKLLPEGAWFRGSKEVDGIDVHQDFAGVDASNFALREELAEEGAHGLSALGFQNEMHSTFASNHGYGSRSRPQELDGVGCHGDGGLGELARGPVDLDGVRAADLQEPQVAKRRVVGALSESELGFHEAFGVVVWRRDRRMVRVVGLDQYAPGSRARPRARRLGEQLEGSLGTPEIWHPEPLVGHQDTHESHIGEIMPFGHHLCAHQNIDIPLANLVENGDGPFPAAVSRSRRAMRAPWQSSL